MLQKDHDADGRPVSKGAKAGAPRGPKLDEEMEREASAASAGGARGASDVDIDFEKPPGLPGKSPERGENGFSAGRVPVCVEPRVDALDGLIRHPPFHQWLGVTAVEAAPGRVRLRLPPNPAFVGNPFVPAVHGGIVAALVDLAGGAALFHDLQFPTPTIDMRVDYLRPAIAGKALLAEARVKSLGRTVAFVDVDVSDEDGRLVATGRCTYSVKDREQGPRGFPIG